VVGPFCGRKGRTRLAVIDAWSIEGVADLLLDQLEVSENLLVYGTGLDPDVGSYLAEQRPGAVAQLVPAAILTALWTTAPLDADASSEIADDPPELRRESRHRHSRLA